MSHALELPVLFSLTAINFNTRSKRYGSENKNCDREKLKYCDEKGIIVVKEIYIYYQV